MNDKRLPDGQCEGRNLPDRGVATGVTDTYNTTTNDLERGYTDKSSIRKHTGSDT